MEDILEAATGGKLQLLRSILSVAPGAINAVDRKGNTALHTTVRRGLREAAAVLVGHGASLLVRNHQGNTPLHEAVRAASAASKRYRASRKLSDVLHDASDRSSAQQEVSAVSRASQMVSPRSERAETAHAMALLLLSRKDDARAALEVGDDGGKTPLHLVCEFGLHELLAEFIALFASSPRADMEQALESQDCSGSTALHLACRRQHILCAELLLKRGACPTSRSHCGRTPLHEVVTCQRSGSDAMDIISLLLSGGSPLSMAQCEMRDHDGQTPLHVAAQCGDALQVQALLCHHAVLSATDRKGNNALHLAAARNATFVIRALLQAERHAPNAAECLVSASNSSGDTPMHSAAAAGAVDALRLLLSHDGARLDVQSKNGDSLMHVACREQQREMFRFLLYNGGDLFLLNQQEKMPPELMNRNLALDGLLHAIRHFHHEENSAQQLSSCVAFLLQPPVLQTWCPLHYALAAGNVVAACVLIDGGASLTQKNHRGRTALDVIPNSAISTALLEHACKSCNVQLVRQLLLENTAPCYPDINSPSTSGESLLLRLCRRITKYSRMDGLQDEQVSVESYAGLTSIVELILSLKPDLRLKHGNVTAARAIVELQSASTLQRALLLCVTTSAKAGEDATESKPCIDLSECALRRLPIPFVSALAMYWNEVRMQHETSIILNLENNKLETLAATLADFPGRILLDGNPLTLLPQACISRIGTETGRSSAASTARTITSRVRKMKPRPTPDLFSDGDDMQGNSDISISSSFDISSSPVNSPSRSRSAARARVSWTAVRRYLHTVLERAGNWSQCKVVFVGQEAVGKTTLVRELGCSNPCGVEYVPIAALTIQQIESLQSKKYRSSCASNVSTDGIRITRDWTVRCKPPRTAAAAHTDGAPSPMGAERVDTGVAPSYFSPTAAEPYQAHYFDLWDLGGQEVFYPTHNFFLTTNSVYVLVFNLASFETSRVDYWMQSIRMLSGNSRNAPIVLVGTHLDDKACTKSHVNAVMEKLHGTFARYRFRGLQWDTEESGAVVAVSCRAGTGMEAFVDCIVKAAQSSTVTGASVPFEWVQLFDILRSRDTALTNTSTLREWAWSCNIETQTELDAALAFLQDTGGLMHFKQESDARLEGLLRDMVVGDRKNRSQDEAGQQRASVYPEGEAYDEEFELWASGSSLPSEENPVEEDESAARAEDSECSKVEAWTKRPKMVVASRPLVAADSVEDSDPDTDGSDELRGRIDSSSLEGNRMGHVSSQDAVTREKAELEGVKQLSELVILDPQWLADVMSALITFSHRWVKRGMLEVVHLPQVFAKFHRSLHRPLIDLLQRFHILIHMKSRSALGLSRVLVPSLLPTEAPEKAVEEAWPTILPDYTWEHGRNYSFPFLPLGFFPCVMCRAMHLHAAVGKVFWRHGLILTDHDAIQQVYLSFDPLSYQFSIRVRMPIKTYHRPSLLPRSLLLLQLLEAVESIITDKYKIEHVERTVPCTHCLMSHRSMGAPTRHGAGGNELRLDKARSSTRRGKAFFFTFRECVEAATAGTEFLFCHHIPSASRCVRLDHLAPDVAFFGLSSLPAAKGSSSGSFLVHHEGLPAPDSKEGTALQCCNEQELVLREVLGVGGFGRVYRGILRGGLDVAVKELSPPEGEDAVDSCRAPESTFLEFQQEAYIMSLLSHPNIVRMYGVSRKPRPRLIMEFLPHGDLFALLHPKESKSALEVSLREEPHLETVDLKANRKSVSSVNPMSLGAAPPPPSHGSTQSLKSDAPLPAISREDLPWRLRLLIAYDIARGMAYLASRSPPIVHRDLRSPNILLASLSQADDEIRAKVGDFGLSRVVLGDVHGALSTWQWVAPEVISANGNAYDHKSDVYSFGIICWELASRQFPFDEFLTKTVETADGGVVVRIDSVNVIERRKSSSAPSSTSSSASAGSQSEEVDVIAMKQAIVGQNLRPSLPPATEECPDRFANLIERCWQHEPAQRPSFAVIVKELERLLSVAAPARPLPSAMVTPKVIDWRSDGEEAEVRFTPQRVLKEDGDRGTEGEGESEGEGEGECVQLVEWLHLADQCACESGACCGTSGGDGSVWLGFESGDIARIHPRESAHVQWRAHCGAVHSIVRVAVECAHYYWSGGEDGFIRIWTEDMSMVHEFSPYQSLMAATATPVHTLAIVDAEFEVPGGQRSSREADLPSRTVWCASRSSTSILLFDPRVASGGGVQEPQRHTWRRTVVTTLASMVGVKSYLLRIIELECEGVCSLQQCGSFVWVGLEDSLLIVSAALAQVIGQVSVGGSMTAACLVGEHTWGCGEQGDIMVWHASGEDIWLLRRHEVHTQRIGCILGPDELAAEGMAGGDEEKIVITGGDDRAIIVWSGTGMKPVQEILGVHNGRVRCLTATSDRVVSACDDGVVCFWRVARA